MTRMLAVFDSRDALLAAIDAAKRHHLTVVTALVPAHDDEVIEAVGVPVSWAGRIACGGGIVGGLAGLLFPAWTVEQWPHVLVGGKPLLSWPTFVIIAFEAALLCAALAAGVAFLIGTWRSRRMADPDGAALLRAARPLISDASSGLLIACSSDRAYEAAAICETHGAVKCHVR